MAARRNLRREKIHVEWSLQWLADRLMVTVRGRPAERNCALFLVVEETPVSKQRLHTAFLVPLNNQVTLVPRSFSTPRRRRGSMWARSPTR
jgi:hypothetical protein